MRNRSKFLVFDFALKSLMHFMTLLGLCAGEWLSRPWLSPRDCCLCSGASLGAGQGCSGDSPETHRGSQAGLEISQAAQYGDPKPCHLYPGDGGIQ